MRSLYQAAKAIITAGDFEQDHDDGPICWFCRKPYKYISGAGDMDVKHAADCLFVALKREVESYSKIEERDDNAK